MDVLEIEGNEVSVEDMRPTRKNLRATAVKVAWVK